MFALRKIVRQLKGPHLYNYMKMSKQKAKLATQFEITVVTSITTVRLLKYILNTAWRAPVQHNKIETHIRCRFSYLNKITY
jgi:uncharacterized BrkB/YihY/UPF0761 family membrane protein